MQLKPIDIRECQQLLLQAAEVFDRICRKHNIPYFMVGGTMLGAVRHQGFIPWDDDLDFAIPRPYFEKTQTILENELPNNLKLLSYKNSKAINKRYLKIELLNTRVIESTIEYNDPLLYTGISIDLFPLDGAKRNTLKDKLLIKTEFALQRLLEARYCSLSIRKGLKKGIAIFLKALPINNSKLAAIIDSIAMKNDFYQTSEIANFYGHWKTKEIVSKDVFENRIEYPFETLKLYGTKEYDRYLKCMYGDYMTIPPLEQRLIHSENMYIIQPDNQNQ